MTQRIQAVLSNSGGKVEDVKKAPAKGETQPPTLRHSDKWTWNGRFRRRQCTALSRRLSSTHLSYTLHSYHMSIIPDIVIELCQSSETVTAALAASPNSAVSTVADKLYKHIKRRSHGHCRSRSQDASRELTTFDLDRATECGKFSSRPSDLFLQVCDSQCMIGATV